ncbi:MAG: hypothetical protein LC623_02940 [Halobacteriales archaeon]|nr:hypothetical protein [Halobacteriales archaeon]
MTRTTTTLICAAIVLLAGVATEAAAQSGPEWQRTVKGVGATTSGTVSASVVGVLPTFANKVEWHTTSSHMCGDADATFAHYFSLAGGAVINGNYFHEGSFPVHQENPTESGTHEGGSYHVVGIPFVATSGDPGVDAAQIPVNGIAGPLHMDPTASGSLLANVMSYSGSGDAYVEGTWVYNGCGAAVGVYLGTMNLPCASCVVVSDFYWQDDAQGRVILADTDPGGWNRFVAWRDDMGAVPVGYFNAATQEGGSGGFGLGHIALTTEDLAVSSFDFKGGAGIVDPTDAGNPCTVRLLGARGLATAPSLADPDLGINANGPGAGISNLAPPLTPIPAGWLAGGAGMDLGEACPIPGAGPGDLWLAWSGVNWRSVEADSSSQMSLCTQETFVASSPGCLPVPGSGLALYVSACEGTTFGHDYTDGRGRETGGQPYDTLAMMSQSIRCMPTHSHDYTWTVQDFGSGIASQGHDLIKNEAIVHIGAGSRYMAICWSVDYLDFSDPLSPMSGVATAHDWKLILDLGDPGGAAGIAGALLRHFGGAQGGDGGFGPSTQALRGLSDQSGNNGFGPCQSGIAPEAKKPTPLV